jgi:formylmethanofuran dehydrogenase subunit B
MEPSHGLGEAPSIDRFTCPTCRALCDVLKVEAGPETIFRDVTCRVCGGPLAGREGKFVLKYFLSRKGGRIQTRRA